MNKGKRIALLSAGPLSLDLFDETEIYDIRIGVNTAVTKFGCDYWSIADAHRFEDIIPEDVIGLPKVFMIGAQRDRVLAHQPERLSKHEVLIWEDVSRKVEAPPKWETWSAIGALVLAKFLGAQRVDCYGVDWSGEKDCTGAVDKQNRNEKRWGREKKQWNEVVKWMKEHDVLIQRISRS